MLPRGPGAGRVRLCGKSHCPRCRKGKARRFLGRRARSKRSDLWLEGEFSADADHAGPTNVAACGCLGWQTKANAEQPDIVLRQAGIFHGRIDVPEVEVIQGVGGGQVHLKARMLAQLEVLVNRSVKPVLSS